MDLDFGETPNGRLKSKLYLLFNLKDNLDSILNVLIAELIVASRLWRDTGLNEFRILLAF
jgi:hypothetical protein